MKRFSRPALVNLAKYMSQEETHKFAVFLICEQLRKNSIYLNETVVHTEFCAPLEGVNMLAYVIDKLVYESLGTSDPAEMAFDTDELVSKFGSLFELELTNCDALCAALS